MGDLTLYVGDDSADVYESVSYTHLNITLNGVNFIQMKKLKQKSNLLLKQEINQNVVLYLHYIHICIMPSGIIVKKTIKQT